MKLKFLSYWLLMVVIVLPLGCKKPLPLLYPEARSIINSNSIILRMQQSKILVQYEDIQSGGGLVSAAIHSKVEDSKDKRIGPIQEALLDFDYPQVLKESLQSGFSNVKWIGNNTTIIERQAEAKPKTESFESCQSDTVVYIELKYQFTPSFGAIDVIAKTSMFPKNKALLKYRENATGQTVIAGHPGDSIYRNNKILVRKMLDKGKIDKDQRVKFWTDNNAALTKQKLKEAAGELTQQIIEDLERSNQ